MQRNSLLPKSHSHMWVVGILGVLAGLLLLTYFPSLKAISGSALLLSAFHLLGAVVMLLSLYVTVGGSRLRRSSKRLSAEKSAIDYGWAPAWTLGPLVLSIFMAAMAVAIQVAAPAWWPAAFAAMLLSANAFIGFLITTSTTDSHHASLPMISLLPTGAGTVLDGGCGAGRTSIAVAQALPRAHLVALDRFDASYIVNGARTLLEENLQLTGLVDRVRVTQGDLTALPFADETFDAAVSAHAMDHLGNATDIGLSEMRRVLKPGGHFLLVVWVPGWTMFAIANVFSFLLAGKARWRSRLQRAGFEIDQEGNFNGCWFVVLRKPDSA